MRSIGRWCRGAAFALAVAGSLGFGASQAFAAPAEECVAPVERVCSVCFHQCGSLGGTYDSCRRCLCCG